MFTTRISENIYIETYKIFNSGAYGGDINMDVMTDSLTFRVIVGRYDTYDEYYNYKCDGDKIEIYYGREVGRISTSIISSETKLFSELSQLNNSDIPIEQLPRIFN